MHAPPLDGAHECSDTDVKSWLQRPRGAETFPRRISQGGLFLFFGKEDEGEEVCKTRVAYF